MIRSRSMGSGPVVCGSPTWRCRRCSARCWCFVCCLGVSPTAILRDHWAPLLGKAPDDMTPGQMTYHLRRLRLHGLIERIPGTHRYRVTRQGGRAALFCTRTYNRLLRPGLAQIIPEEARDDSELRRGFDQLDEKIDDWIERAEGAGVKLDSFAMSFEVQVT